MGTFRFRLQPLLDHRLRLEERARYAFAACRHNVEENLSELNRLADQMAAVLRAGVSGLHISVINAAIAARRRRATELDVAMQRVRADFIVARRERAVIEKLRERRYAQYEAGEARREELELDEANTIRRYFFMLRQAQHDKDRKVDR